MPWNCDIGVLDAAAAWKVATACEIACQSAGSLAGEPKLRAFARFKRADHEEIKRMVPVVGVEPTHGCPWQILNLLRLPIPPHRHRMCPAAKPSGGRGRKYRDVRRIAEDFV